MIMRLSLLAAAVLLVFWSRPVVAAEYERSGDWVFQAQAFAEVGGETLSACSASTKSLDGTELSLRLEPAPDNAFEAGMSLTNESWALGQGQMRVRLDIGADHWVLPAESDGSAVTVDWTGEASLLTFLEDLSSSSFAAVIARDGSTHAQFSLKGSRKAAEAMKTCVEVQIGRGLSQALEAGSPGGAATPF